MSTNMNATTNRPQMVFVSREEWGAAPPNDDEEDPLPLETPVSEVLCTTTNTDPCTKAHACSTYLKELQAKQMENGLSDIAYNFMIAGDLRVYVGRGWNTQPSILDPGCPKDRFEGKSLYLAYIGDFSDEKFPSDKVLDVRDELVRWGIQKGYIKDEFEERMQWEPVQDFDYDKYNNFVTGYLLKKGEKADLLPQLRQRERRQK